MVIDNFSLECFLAVVKTGSFSKASESIGRTQSAVSQQIAKIELYLGKKLFIRNKNILLTYDGETFYHYAKQINGLYRQLIQQFRRSEVHGEVKFGLPEDFITIFLDSVLSEFTHIHPKVTINIECDLSLNLLDRFQKREFDLVLLKMEKIENSGNCVEVWSEELDWVGNKQHAQCLNLEKEIPLVLSPSPCLYRLRALTALEEKSINTHIVFTSASYNSKIAAVKAGLGITVLPKSMIPNYLYILNHSALPKLSDTHISLLKHNHHNLLVSSFGDFVLKKLKH